MLIHDILELSRVEVGKMELQAYPWLASVPVVMVSMVDHKSIGYVLGASEYLVKLLDRERLFEALSRCDSSGDGVALIIHGAERGSPRGASSVRRADHGQGYDIDRRGYRKCHRASSRR